MRVFVTGATGYIGGAVARRLLDEGHKVIGLARSSSSTDRLTAMGATPQSGDLTDLESLRAGALGADAGRARGLRPR